MNSSKPNITTEIIAGASTFLASSYIIIVNPSILSQTGMSFGAVVTATILVSFFSSLMMGLYARNPILVAPGMGLNAFFTFSVVQGMNVPWEVALGAVFWSGIIFLLLSIFNIRTLIVQAIPKPLRYAITSGIGLFISLIGFVNAGMVTHHPATVITAGKLSPSVITFLIGLAIMIILLIRKVKGGILLGIIITSFLAYPLGRWWGDATIVNIQNIWSAPDFSLLFKLDLINSLSWAMAPVIFSFVFTDLFDSLSTFVGLTEAANLLDENGEPKNLKQSLMTDAVSTVIAGVSGSSPGTAYIESAVGIEAGGRTGITAITAAVLFLPFLFFSPLLSAVPAVATAPAIVLVGAFMLQPIIKINWRQWDEALPCFFAMVLIPFTYSISQGIIWGFFSWTLCKVAAGKSNEVSMTLWLINLFCLMALILS